MTCKTQFGLCRYDKFFMTTAADWRGNASFGYSPSSWPVRRSTRNGLSILHVRYGAITTALKTELKAAGCQRVFQEKINGARSDRKQLARLLAELDDGDVVIVTRLDRLARSTRGLFEPARGHRGAEGRVAIRRLASSS